MHLSFEHVNFAQHIQTDLPVVFPEGETLVMRDAQDVGEMVCRHLDSVFTRLKKAVSHFTGLRVRFSSLLHLMTLSTSPCNYCTMALSLLSQASVRSSA